MKMKTREVIDALHNAITVSTQADRLKENYIAEKVKEGHNRVQIEAGIKAALSKRFAKQDKEQENQEEITTKLNDLVGKYQEIQKIEDDKIKKDKMRGWKRSVTCLCGLSEQPEKIKENIEKAIGNNEKPIIE